jgi:glycine/D-amino acid oxidase-like deaminating enzyme
MSLSYWEHKEWFANNDFVIVGSGIVGLNCGLQLKNQFPKAKILVLEKGLLPQGASTKNAGFACFGSVSELLSDLKTHSEEEVCQLVKKRWDGLQLLRQTLGDDTIDYQHLYGYELFQEKNFFDACEEQIPYLNQLLKPLFQSDVFSTIKNVFSFQNVVPKYMVNHFEGQIDTGKMMAALLKKAQGLGIKILNNVEVTSYSEDVEKVILNTQQGEIKARKVLFATNGFSKQFFQEDIRPARAQVLITKPIENLHLRGTFHLDEGYYYFRNINNRILFGGGRNLDFQTEETTEFGQTQRVQNKLEEILHTTIFPNTDFEIDQRWSGIMGVGQQKKAIVKQISDRIYCGIRLGGMGVAIGSIIGKELASLVD